MLAKVANDNAAFLTQSGVLGFFASKLAPTVIKKAILSDRLFYYFTTFKLGRPLGRGGSLSGGGISSSGSISSSSSIGDSRSNTMP